MRRILVILIGALLVLASACGSNERAQQVSTDDPVAAVSAAAEASAAANSYRFALSTDVSATDDNCYSATPQSVEGELLLDEGGDRARVRIPGGDPGADVLVVGDELFAPASVVPDDWGLTTEWVSVTADDWDAQNELGDAVMFGSSFLPQPEVDFGNDPRAWFEQLTAAADVANEIGNEDIRGIPTTHYDLEFSAEAWADTMMPEPESFEEWRDDLPPELTPPEEELREMYEAESSMSAELTSAMLPDVEVWIGNEGLIHRVQFHFSADELMGMDMTSALEIWDYGVEVGATEPPPEQVTAASTIEIPFDESAYEDADCEILIPEEDLELGDETMSDEFLLEGGETVPETMFEYDEGITACVDALGFDIENSLPVPEDPAFEEWLACFPPDEAEMMRCMATMEPLDVPPDPVDLDALDALELPDCLTDLIPEFDCPPSSGAPDPNDCVPAGDPLGDIPEGYDAYRAVTDEERACFGDLALALEDAPGGGIYLDEPVPEDPLWDGFLACLPASEAAFTACRAEFPDPMTADPDAVAACMEADGP